MKLLDRYMLREMVVPFLIGQAAIVLMLTGTILYNNAEIFLIHQVPVVDVARLVLFFVPFLVHMTMPVAMAVAASLCVSRMGRDSEITVMRASGISLVRIFTPIFAVGMAVSVADFVFGEYVVPASMDRFDAVCAELPNHIRHLSPHAGQFIVSNDQSFAIYVKTMVPQPDRIELHGITVFNSPKVTYTTEAQPMVLAARDGEYREGRWTFFKPFIIQYSLDGSQKFVTGTPGTVTYFIAVNPQTFQSSFLMSMPMGTMANNSRLTFSKLGEEIRRLKKQKINDPYSVLDYYFKLSVPCSCLVMALCCPPLAHRFARGGGFMGTLLSICLVFLYWNTLLLSRILGSPGPGGSAPLLSAPVAAWSQNVIFIAVGLFVLRRSE
jgi:lipopolysaccharide export system permease protein